MIKITFSNMNCKHCLKRITDILKEHKIKVKDSIVLYLQEELKDARCLDEARNILYYGRDEIKNIALEVIEEEGYDYPVEVYFEESYFQFL